MLPQKLHMQPMGNQHPEIQMLKTKPPRLSVTFQGSPVLPMLLHHTKMCQVSRTPKLLVSLKHDLPAIIKMVNAVPTPSETQNGALDKALHPSTDISLLEKSDKAAPHSY